MKNRSSSRRIALLALTVLVVACQDNTVTTPLAPPAAATFSVAQAHGPLRSADTTRSWVHRTDDSLWSAVAAADSLAVVGVMTPGAGRGVWKGRMLISPSDKAVALGNLRGQGLQIVRALDPMPAYLVRIRSRAQLAMLRRLPFVDYIEPAGWHEPNPVFQSGCGTTGAGDVSYSTPEGDVYGWSYDGWHHRIDQAWQRSAGDNVRVAILDTGIDPAQPQFFGQFFAGLSSNRFLAVAYSEPASIDPAWRDICGHGTRVAGLIGAPRDGQGAVGIAYKADILTMRVGSDVNNWFNEIDVYDGLVEAVGGWGARVVEMAFGASNFSYLIEDYIAYTYWNAGGPVYVAAMGNTDLPNANFPAEMDEVIGAVAINPDGSRNGNSNWGPSAELGGFIPAVSTGNITMGDAPVSYIGQTSGASATIAGVAALVFGVHPDWSNFQVRQRLQLSGTHPYDTNWQNGHGPVDAYKAVGGLQYVLIEGAICGTRGEEVAIQANPYGDGPFAYRWSTGSTESSTLLTASYTVGARVAADVEVTDLVSGQRTLAYHEIYTTLSESGDCNDGGGGGESGMSLSPTKVARLEQAKRDSVQTALASRRGKARLR